MLDLLRHRSTMASRDCVKASSNHGRSLFGVEQLRQQLGGRSGKVRETFGNNWETAESFLAKQTLVIVGFRPPKCIYSILKWPQEGPFFSLKLRLISKDRHLICKALHWSQVDQYTICKHLLGTFKEVRSTSEAFSAEIIVGRLSRATSRVSHHWSNYVKLFFFLPNNMFSTCFISTPSNFLMVFDPICDPWASASSSQPLLDSPNDFSFFGRRSSACHHWISMLFAHVDCNWWVTGCCTCEQIIVCTTLMEAGMWVVPFGLTVIMGPRDQSPIMGLQNGPSHLLTTALQQFQLDRPLITATLLMWLCLCLFTIVL